jgi:hypothetical protein
VGWMNSVVKEGQIGKKRGRIGADSHKEAVKRCISSPTTEETHGRSKKLWHFGSFKEIYSFFLTWTISPITIDYTLSGKYEPERSIVGKYRKDLSQH